MDQQETHRATVGIKHKSHMIRLIVLIALAGSAWWLYATHFPHWNEDVMLSDGRIITVHREHRFNLQGRLLETALTFDLPEMGGKQTWREQLYPAMVNVHQDQVYVVGDVTPKLADAYADPKYGYVAFTYIDQGWRRVPFASLPESIRQEENMVGCKAAMNYKTWSEKQAGWCNLADEFVPGASRAVDLPAREYYARENAAMRGTTTRSE
jgi:hypothetical protein